MTATPPIDRLLRPLYWVLSASFALVGLLFFAFPDGTVDALNAAGGIFGFREAPHMAHRFWLGLGAAYMAVVATLAALIAPAPTERRLLMLPLAVGKAVSSGTCLLFFVFADPFFIYLANFLVDGGLVVIVLWTWRLTDPARGGGAGGSGRAAPGGDGAGGSGGGAVEMGPRSRAVLRSIAETFLPPGGAFPTAASDLDLTAKVEAHMARQDELGPLALASLAWFVEWNPRLFHLRAQRFSRMTLADRVEVLEAMERSRFMVRRQTALVLKLLMGTHAYRDPAVQDAIGYDRGYLRDKLAEAAARREAGGKGPYPEPQAP